MKIGRHEIGPGHPCFIVAELGANHKGNLLHMMDLVTAAFRVGADAVKFQHYKPEHMGPPDTAITKGPWAGRRFSDLYGEAAMPWEWTEKLVEWCEYHNMTWFSSVYHREAVDFLEPFEPVAYKISSFENMDTDLIRYVQDTGRPLVLSDGMVRPDEAIVARMENLALLYCVSAYPTPPEAVDLGLISGRDYVAGFSDHTLSIGVPVAAVVKGAEIIEKHLTLSRSDPTPDAAFSLEPSEFAIMVQAIRDAEAAMGPCPEEDVEAASRLLRRAPGGYRGSYVG